MNMAKITALTTTVLILISCVYAAPAKALCPSEKIEKLADIPHSSDYSVCNLQKMHIEDDKLIVCANTGLYAIDLNVPSVAEPYGFAGIPIADFIKNGSTILARRGDVVVNGSVENKLPYAYISNDNGKTYKAFYPEKMHHDVHGDCWSFISSMAQNPHNDDEILVLNLYGLWKSTDFGATWTHLSEYRVGNSVACFMEYFPHDTETFMYHGENMIFQDSFYITRDGGKSWQFISGIFPGDNCMHQMAFHPTDPNVWVYGGEGCIGLTEDAGHTFNIVWNVWSDTGNNAYFYNILFDQSNHDVIFAAGETSSSEVDGRFMRVVASCDKGKTWEKVAEIPVARDQFENNPIDMIQTNRHLYIMTSDSKVYRVLKKDLMAATGIKSDFIDSQLLVSVSSNSISFNSEVSDICIYSMSGKGLVNNRSNGKLVDISDLPNDVYILSFVYDSTPRSVKFVRK